MDAPGRKRRYTRSGGFFEVAIRNLSAVESAGANQHSDGESYGVEAGLAVCFLGLVICGFQWMRASDYPTMVRTGQAAWTIS